MDECLTTQTATAAEIDVGTIALQPNTPNQIVRLLVSGGDAVTGFNLRAEIGDGVNPAPVFQAISFACSIWDAYPNTTTGALVSGYEEYAQYSVAFNTNVTVPATGVLLTLTLDTTGLTTDRFYPLRLSGVELIGANSDFPLSGGGTLAPVINNGELHVVTAPEPHTLGLLVLAAISLSLRRRRHPH